MKVIVYQMGKVASTAIVQSLREVGVDAHQSHFLGRAALHESLDSLLNPHITPHHAQHGTGQLFVNLALTRELSSPNLRVITLGRHPIDWYAANLIQNLPAYERDFAGEGPLEDRLSEFMANLARILVPPAAAPDAFQKAVTGLPISREFKEHMMTLYRPIYWFKKMFEPVFGVDITRRPIPPNGRTFESKNARILALRYEDLNDNSIKAFLELPEFTLQRTNESEGKVQSTAIRRAVTNHLSDPIGMWKMDYCRAFGYHSGNSRLSASNAASSSVNRSCVSSSL